MFKFNISGHVYIVCVFVGDIGQMLDSVRIKTDSVAEKPPLLTYSDVLKICAVLKGSGKNSSCRFAICEGNCFNHFKRKLNFRRTVL